MSSWLEITAVLTGLASVVLAGRQNVFTFVIGLMNSTLFAIFFYTEQLYSAMALQCCYFVIDLYGVAKWLGLFGLNGRENRLAVSRLGTEAMGAIAAIVMVGGVMWALFVVRMSGLYPDLFPNPRYPLLDATLTAASIAAQVLLTRKRINTWTIWITVDAINACLYISMGIYMTSALHILYIGIAANAIREWRLSEPKNKELKNKN